MTGQFETYVTVDGDMVDEIAYRRFGYSAGVTEAIYDANPGLAARGLKLPAGITIKIPVPDVKPRLTQPRVWS